MMGLVSFRSPFLELATILVAKADLKSIFCLVVFFIVIFVLAYLTNPTENSFRTYLTEQSFRQHLSRLDDNVDDDHKDHALTSRSSSLRSNPPCSGLRSFDNGSTFHFANRASISLRTPKHAFHSFGLFTIAAVLPSPKHGHGDERDSPMICDLWYIGAFGRWWRGGIIEAWYQDVIARSKDEESWSSGILNMKNLDMFNDYKNGLPFTTKNLPPHLLSRGAPPRLRNREKSSQRSVLPPRSSTPPPLPKSASLPLHATRLPSATHFDRLTSNPPQPSLLTLPYHPVDPPPSGTPFSRPPSALFDSPRIADVLRQITQSKEVILDLRVQLNDSQSTASQTHTALQDELETLRERKRQDDASKVEAKSRTKTLDDSKRQAESLRKDADKKLKLVQSSRDSAAQRIEYLDKEIILLKDRAVHDEALLLESQETVSDAEKDLFHALEQKKQEIQVTEDLIATLNHRTRELEEKLAEQKDKLQRLKDDKCAREHELSVQFTQSVGWNDFVSQSMRPALADALDSAIGLYDLCPTKHQAHIKGDVENLSRRSSLSGDIRLLLPSNISAGTLNGSPTATHIPINKVPILHANGYPVFDDTVRALAPASYQQSPSGFAPFSDAEHDMLGFPVVSANGQSLVPASLITSLDNSDGFSRSFQSDRDLPMDRDWRSNVTSYAPSGMIKAPDSQPSGTGMLTSSPVSLHGTRDHDDWFDLRFTSDYGRERQSHYKMTNDASSDLHHFNWTHRRNSDPSSVPVLSAEFNHSSPIVGAGEVRGGMDWLSAISGSFSSSKDKPKKGLNPDAKVFSLSRKSQAAPTSAAFDALNPNGVVPSSASPSSSSTCSSLLRAFAPSPAEREALQRALGGGANTSFERLPSLSDVGNIPSTSQHVQGRHPGHEGHHSLPSWLQALPKVRKMNFNPWDNEEPVPKSGGSL